MLPLLVPLLVLLVESNDAVFTLESMSRSSSFNASGVGCLAQHCRLILNKYDLLPQHHVNIPLPDPAHTVLAFKLHDARSSTVLIVLAYNPFEPALIGRPGVVGVDLSSGILFNRQLPLKASLTEMQTKEGSVLIWPSLEDSSLQDKIFWREMVDRLMHNSDDAFDLWDDDRKEFVKYRQKFAHPYTRHPNHGLHHHHQQASPDAQLASNVNLPMNHLKEGSYDMQHHQQKNAEARLRNIFDQLESYDMHHHHLDANICNVLNEMASGANLPMQAYVRQHQQQAVYLDAHICNMVKELDSLPIHHQQASHDMHYDQQANLDAHVRVMLHELASECNKVPSTNARNAAVHYEQPSFYNSNVPMHQIMQASNDISMHHQHTSNYEYSHAMSPLQHDKSVRHGQLGYSHFFRLQIPNGFKAEGLFCLDQECQKLNTNSKVNLQENEETQILEIKLEDPYHEVLAFKVVGEAIAMDALILAYDPFEPEIGCPTIGSVDTTGGLSFDNIPKHEATHKSKTWPKLDHSKLADFIFWRRVSERWDDVMRNDVYKLWDSEKTEFVKYRQQQRDPYIYASH